MMAVLKAFNDDKIALYLKKTLSKAFIAGEEKLIPAFKHSKKSHIWQVEAGN